MGQKCPKSQNVQGAKVGVQEGKARSPAGGSCPSLRGVQRQLSPAPGRRRTGPRWRTSATRSWSGHSSGRSAPSLHSVQGPRPGGAAERQPRSRTRGIPLPTPAWPLQATGLASAAKLFGRSLRDSELQSFWAPRFLPVSPSSGDLSE